MYRSAFRMCVRCHVFCRALLIMCVLHVRVPCACTQELVSALRAFHHQAQTQADKRHMAQYGLELTEGKVRMWFGFWVGLDWFQLDGIGWLCCVVLWRYGWMDSTGLARCGSLDSVVQHGLGKVWWGRILGQCCTAWPGQGVVGADPWAVSLHSYMTLQCSI